MSDAQIAGVVLSAAATDISQAELALRNASHPRVKTLAREMVAELRELLARLDGLLLPKAQSREVRGLLVSIRPVFESHLNHAESVAAELEG